VAIVTSYCPDGIAATELILDAPRPLRVLYDLDTPVTLAVLKAGQQTSYIGPQGLAGFDLVLSFTGGAALDELRTDFGAKRVEALYGHVDAQTYRPSATRSHFRSDLSYLGTYTADRQQSLETLLVDAARQRPDRSFLIGGAQYPVDFPWAENIFFVRHLPPDQHPAFYSSSRLTLNITRQTMAALGWCPSGRLFEAAACGAAIISDQWQGLEDFFVPGEEILVAHDTADTVAALDLSDVELRRLGEAARSRVLSSHTCERRADDLLSIVGSASGTVAIQPELRT
jgi:spore maturation protein CgeB